MTCPMSHWSGIQAPLLRGLALGGVGASPISLGVRLSARTDTLPHVWYGVRQDHRAVHCWDQRIGAHPVARC